MKKLLHFILIIFLCGVLSEVSAQNQNNRWYFGINAGLNFNSGSPVALTDGALFSNEGCATISDNSGNLLFYTNGVIVADPFDMPLH